MDDSCPLCQLKYRVWYVCCQVFLSGVFGVLFGELPPQKKIKANGRNAK